MSQCPMCLEDKRALGSIVLMTPEMIEGTIDPIVGKCCTACLTLISQFLDRWQNGGLRDLVHRLQQQGLIRTN